MSNIKTRLRLEDTELLVRSLGEMLRAVSCHCNSIEDEEISSILFIASYAAEGISRDINVLTEEVRNTDK